MERKSTFLIAFKCQYGQNATSDTTSRRDRIFPPSSSGAGWTCVGEGNTCFRDLIVEGKHLKHESLKRQLWILLSLVCCRSACHRWGWIQSRSPAGERNRDWSREQTHLELNYINQWDNLRERKSWSLQIDGNMSEGREACLQCLWTKPQHQHYDFKY